MTRDYIVHPVSQCRTSLVASALVNTTDLCCVQCRRRHREEDPQPLSLLYYWDLFLLAPLKISRVSSAITSDDQHAGPEKTRQHRSIVSQSCDPSLKVHVTYTPDSAVVLPYSVLKAAMYGFLRETTLSSLYLHIVATALLLNSSWKKAQYTMVSPSDTKGRRTKYLPANGYSMLFHTSVYVIYIMSYLEVRHVFERCKYFESVPVPIFDTLEGFSRTLSTSSPIF